MEVGLIIALFMMNAVALDCLYNHRYKLTGALLIGNLCLTVALCYQFQQMEKIYYLFLIVIGIIIVFFGVRFYIRKRKNSAIIDKNKRIEKK